MSLQTALTRGEAYVQCAVDLSRLRGGTNTMTFDIDAIAAQLIDDGDTCEIEVLTNGAEGRDDRGTWTFRLRIEPDDTCVSDIEDDEVFGQYETREYGRGDQDRPDGFTGAAVKIASESTQGIYFWYEPSKDFRKFKGSGFPSVEAWEKAKANNLRNVRNLLSWGYVQIGVEVTHRRPDGYKRKWSEWVGAVESGTGLWGDPLNDHDRYVAELIREQLVEALVQAIQEVPGTCWKQLNQEVSV